MKKMTRQRRWQLRKKEAGLCIKCGKKAVTSEFCESHRKKRNAWDKKRRSAPLTRVKK